MDNLYRSGARGKKSVRYLGGDIRLRKSLLDFCLETGPDELLPQWDEHLNGPLTAADIAYGSKRKVWWRCAKGHEWQRMSLLREEEGADRLQRPRDPRTAAVKTVAPETERQPDARNGHPRLPPQGLVAVSRGPRMEGRHLLPLRPSKKRLPHLRGAGQISAFIPHLRV